MHSEHTIKSASDAMPSLTRRAMLLGAMVAPAGSGSAGESIIPWLLDAYNDLQKESDGVTSELLAIYDHPDYPPRPVVAISELDFQGVYSPVWGRRSFHLLTEIDDFFTTFPDAKWFNSDRRRRHDANHALARNLLRKRLAALDDWKVKTGLSALNDRRDELEEQLIKLEGEILDHRCTTYKECADKAAWFDEAFSGVDVPEYLRRLLQSMVPASSAGEA